MPFEESKSEADLRALREGEEEELARILSEKYGATYADLTRQSINVEALQLMKEADARAALLAIFDRINKRLSVAVKAPQNDATRAALAALEERGFEVRLFMVSQKSLERAWARYKEISGATETHAGVLDISEEFIQKTVAELRGLNDVRAAVTATLKDACTNRVSSILEIILAGALRLSASDVHLEPEEAYVRLRLRLDGVLTDILTFERETFALMLSRIKLISGLKLNVKDEAQDGRFSIDIAENDIEIRTSVLPGAYGESVVLRILDPKTTALPMEELGIDARLFSILEREIRRPNGMILNTGPTGSGKTTTLYAFLRKIHTPDIKIITIEDPVEYHLPGIVQTQVDHKNYTFETGLRSALRQDPDIIMVGEIRDREVAETAINAALTGHLVFSTLHTNNAAGAFPRLVDLGVNPNVIGSAVTVVMAQRLVRRLRPECKEPVELSGARKELVERVLASLPNKALMPKNTTTVWEPKAGEGCEIAYAGRFGIFEAILMDKTIEELAGRSGSEREIAEAARAQGLLTLAQDGILKALSGETSLSELERVLDLSNI